MSRLLMASVLIVLSLLLVSPDATAQKSWGPLEFSVSFAEEYARQRQSGTIYLLISRDLNGEPRHHLAKGHFDGFILSRRVKALAPDEPVVFDLNSPGHPGRLDTLKPGRYAVQALLDSNPTKCLPAVANGNGRSPSRRMRLDSMRSGPIELSITKTMLRENKESRQRAQYEYIESRLVGKQIGARFFVNATVIMPINQPAFPDRKYPVQYWIPDIGEDTRSALKYFQKRGLYSPIAGPEGQFGKEFILVLLDSSCRNGFHAWTDSAANGSFNKALFEDIIPYLEAKYPIIPEASARFLVGKGSGGLAALNLLSDRPDHYAGVWALAPDPVDFRDFYGMNLYQQPLPNAFRLSDGMSRPLVRHNGESAVTVEQQVGYEQAVLTGNLFQSYDAAYSSLGSDLRPVPLINSESGVINPRVAGRYRARDFKNRVEKWWPRIGKHLAGKINIVVGAKDNFFLHRPVLLLKEFLETKNLDFDIRVIPDLDHAGIDNRKIHLGLQQKMLQRWIESR